MAISDLHGHLPEIEPCDLLLIGGDICPDGPLAGRWLDLKFRPWLKSIPAKQVIGIGGNHDFVFQGTNGMEALELPWTYLEDSSITVSGLKIYGSPWVPKLKSWAFYKSNEDLKTYWDDVAECDILMSHGPPYGFGDLSGFSGFFEHAGCKALYDNLKRIKPKALVTGHIHEAYGLYHAQGVDIYNASHMTINYDPLNQPVEIKL